MIKFTIKNFGPIRQGIEEGDYITLDSLTFFIGNQGSGKSSVAKLISTFLWLEKALIRKDFSEKELMVSNRFKNKYCKFSGIDSYFRDDSYIYFKNIRYEFIYENSKLTAHKLEDTADYPMPQITYYPSERNFLSAAEKIDEAKYLPPSVFSLLRDYKRGLRYLSKPFNLPFQNSVIDYDKLNDITWLNGKDYKLRVSEASSGFQSIIPIMITMDYFWNLVQDNKNNEEISVKDSERFHKEVEHILNSNVDVDVKITLLSQISSIRNQCLVSIVEEPEQNLYPESQKTILFKLFEYLNKSPNNRLIITTHSPFVISYLTIAEKAFELRNSVSQDKLSAIVPENSQVDSDCCNVYEINDDGSISKLKTFGKGLPSDRNKLNDLLLQGNEYFNDLLDLEDEIHG